MQGVRPSLCSHVLTRLFFRRIPFLSQLIKDLALSVISLSGQEAFLDKILSEIKTISFKKKCVFHLVFEELAQASLRLNPPAPAPPRTCTCGCHPTWDLHLLPPPHLAGGQTSMASWDHTGTTIPGLVYMKGSCCSYRVNQIGLAKVGDHHCKLSPKVKKSLTVDGGEV